MSNAFGGITGSGGDAWGLRLSSSNGSITARISVNVFRGSIVGGNDAYGMYLSAADYIDTDITNNVSLPARSIEGVNSAYGIYINTPDSLIAEIRYNQFIADITGTGRDAYGMYLNADGSLNTDIRNNLFEYITGSGGDACIMYLSSVNSSIDATVSDNIANGAIGSGNAHGIRLSAGDYIDADITNNNFHSTRGDAAAYGIYLSAIGNLDASITNNTLYIVRGIGAGANAWGVYLHSRDRNIQADISSNSLNVSSWYASAYGAYLEAGGLIGDVTGSPTLFQYNSGVINGSVAPYMLYLNTGTPGGGNSVDWTGNTFTPRRGGIPATWSGSHGPSNEVQENFGIGDTLTP
jgi:hypothetical protein